MNAIYQRKSIRKFTEEAIPREKLLEFVKAGMNAPSAGNSQPWHFIVMTDRAVLLKVLEFHPYSHPLKEAAAAVCVCAEAALEKHKGFWVQDCAAATENMLLEIAGQGYGGVWLGVYPVEERVKGLRSLLGVPEDIVPFSLVAVGRPAEAMDRKTIYVPEKVRSERWA
ncbi:MAG: nitroreductase family protein [Spirochaetia bacterium]|jgi:nitroreductase